MLAPPSYFDASLQSSGRRDPDTGRPFQGMPPFQPPPSSSVLPDPLHPNMFNWTDVIGEREARAGGAGGRAHGRMDPPDTRRHPNKDYKAAGAAFAKRSDSPGTEIQVRSFSRLQGD